MGFHKYCIFIIYLISGFRVGKEVFKVGLNHGFIGKPADPVGMGLGKGWLASEVTQAQLIDHAARKGHAFTAHFEGGHRKAAKFMCSDFIAADIDHGLTLDEALAIPFVRQFASFIYTTPSHTEDEHRFRIVFLLEDTITVGADWGNALLGLAIKFGGDRSVGDSSRLFYGNVDARVFDFGNLLPANEVGDLISAAVQERNRSKPNNRVGSPALTATQRVDPRLIVAMDAGIPIPLEEAAPRTSVQCPFHDDRRASAFVVQSLRGVNGIHCKACNRTFWPEEPIPYDFNSFDRLVQEEIEQDRKRAEAQKHHSNFIERYFPPNPHVRVIQTKYLPDLDYQPGITLIKSPKGSGKTKAIAALVDQIRNRKFAQGVEKKDRPLSVLLVGHRRMLISEAADRLGLDCYLGDKIGTHRKQRFGYAICLDSLRLLTSIRAPTSKANRTKPLPPPQYDVVILDESEQVLSHLLSETLTKRVGRVDAFASLEFVIRRAKAVYALDADLGLITSHAMKDLRPKDWEDNCRIILNQPMPVKSRRQLLMYENEKMLQDRMLDAIRDGKRVFVASNSKTKVDQLAEMIRQQIGENVAMLAITSDNSQEEAEKAFAANIQTEFLKIQVLLCSPSLGTGIDISFPDGTCMVDEVIGFFSSFVNTHADIDQQLARVRNPGAVSVWFQRVALGYETSFDVVREQLAAANFVPTARVDGRLDDNGNPVYNLEDPLLKIVTHVEVAACSSKNDLVPLFIKLRQANGWDVVEIEAPQKPEMNVALAGAATAVKEKKILSLLNARDITEDEFDRLTERMQEQKSVSWDDRHAMERYRLAKTYDRPLNRALIEQDDNGKLRDRCQVFRRIFDDGTFLAFEAPDIKADLERGKAIQADSVWRLVATIMISVGLIVDGKLNRKAIVRSDRLDGFAKLCFDNRVIIQKILGNPVRDDVNEKPVMMLNEFLKRVGLKMKVVRKKVRGGSSGNEYEFDRDRLDVVESIALSRREILQLNAR